LIDIPPGDKRVTHFILELSVPKLPDSEGLAIFAKVVQMHSFVGAATELRLSKATVSMAISRIERKLGARLIQFPPASVTARRRAAWRSQKPGGKRMMAPPVLVSTVR
jgi:hypothetical protein